MSAAGNARFWERRLVATLAAAIVLFAVSHGVAAEDEVPCARPPIQLLRHEEDYSFVRLPQGSTSARSI
jgi:hypothetical protein